MSTFFASDHHFNHARIMEFEPVARGGFNGLQHMNSVIVERHNEVVEDTDTVWFLGDLALGDFDQAMSYASGMKGRKFLLSGNHDKFSKAYQKPAKTPEQEERNARRMEEAKQKYEDAGFTVFMDDDAPVQIEIDGRTVNLSHYPYRGTEKGDHMSVERFTELRPVDDGLPLIHGHIHSLRGIQGRQFNAGIDLFDMYPVHEDTIIEWLRTL